MSFGEAMVEGGQGGAGEGAAAGGEEAAAGEEATGSRGAPAEQVRRPSRPHAAPRPPSIPPTAHHRRPPSDQQSPTQAWAAFQVSAAPSAAQRSHSAFVPPVSALSEDLPQQKVPADRKFSLDSVSPFSAFASGDAPGDKPPSQNWPQQRPGPAAFPFSPFGGPDPPPERQLSMQRSGSIQKVGSLHDWAAFRRTSAERLPSLQDWIMPSLGSSPVSQQRCSLPFEAPIPEASVSPTNPLGSLLFCSEALPQPKIALSRPKGIPPGRHPLHRASFTNESSADEASTSAEGASPSLNTWKLHAPRSPVGGPGDPGRPRAGGRLPGLGSAAGGRARAASASPKRGRASEDSEGIFVGSFDEEAQPQKSPRLNQRPAAAVAPSGARTGSPSHSDPDSGPGFADFHDVMDSLWGNKGGVHPESTPVG